MQIFFVGIILNSKLLLLSHAKLKMLMKNKRSWKRKNVKACSTGKWQYVTNTLYV